MDERGWENKCIASWGEIILYVIMLLRDLIYLHAYPGLSSSGKSGGFSMEEWELE